jgi:hypothetical protein
MLPWLISVLQAFDNPVIAVRVGVLFVASYYAISTISIHFDKPNYSGLWRKNGFVDIGTSVFWFGGTLLLIISFLDFVVRRQIGLVDAVKFYLLFIVLFAFVYRLLDWHFPGMLAHQRPGWAAEGSALVLSIGAMTGGDLGTARPARVLTELIAALQAVLGLLFIAIFVAQAVARTAI